ncbi:sensor histidine kinase [Candidatus Enterococcus murrayae]|uniref:histidine kinase n=1 Tax=Candidatus Enterococcus murrayae TaxID=2815321 RepID=A0ABS3HEQ9_9ENTE|nr:HAMP domain-containing sensor histidine kinase [Enterococcus sp. MJM16]MBO0451936.1 HAMP domain-containing histidine kinase [Enterococcus sp. MJM16]
MQNLRSFLIKLFLGVTIPLVLLNTVIDSLFIRYTNAFSESKSLMISGFFGVTAVKVVIFVLILYIFIRILTKRIQLENVAYNQEKTQLFATIAHDLKTPSTSVLGYAKLLLEEKNIDPQKERQMLETIYDKADQSNQMLELMLQYARLEGTDYPLHLKSSDFSRLIREIVASHYAAFEEKKMELQIDVSNTPVKAVIDPLEFGRALHNILVNALSHNPAGTKILIQLRVDDQLELLIADSGKKLAKEFIPVIFDPFVQEDSSRSKTGTGLGLAITKQIIEKHNGTIQLVENISDYTKGFLIKLPK